MNKRKSVFIAAGAVMACLLAAAGAFGWGKLQESRVEEAVQDLAGELFPGAEVSFGTIRASAFGGEVTVSDLVVARPGESLSVRGATLARGGRGWESVAVEGASWKGEGGRAVMIERLELGNVAFAGEDLSAMRADRAVVERLTAIGPNARHGIRIGRAEAEAVASGLPRRLTLTDMDILVRSGSLLGLKGRSLTLDFVPASEWPRLGLLACDGGPECPETFWERLYVVFDELSGQGLTLRKDGASASVGALVLRSEARNLRGPDTLYLGLGGIEPIAGSEGGKALSSLGVERVAGRAQMRMKWNAHSRRLTFVEAAAESQDLFVARATGAVLLPPAGDAEAFLAVGDWRLEELAADYVDRGDRDRDGLAMRTMRALAEASGRRVDEIRNAWVAWVAHAAAETDSVIAARSFLERPYRITWTMRPPAPISFGELGEMLADESKADPERLGLKVALPKL